MQEPERVARLRQACRRGRLDLDDMIEKARRGEVQIHDTPDACGITALQVSAGVKICYIMAVGGSLSGLSDLDALIEKFAREHGCQIIQTIGRRGWGQVNKQYGFKPVAIMYEKKL
jgi:hypothetical protein